MRALITGITGQDGSYLAELLLSKGYKVYGLVRRLSTKNYWRIEHLLDKIELIEGDLTDSGSLYLALKKANPIEVYNLAAQSYVATSWTQPILTADVTGLGALRMLEAIHQYDPKVKFYQASTSELFGLALETPQKETTPFHPRSPYGAAKAFAHYMTQNYRESYGMFACSGILFNHESPRRGEEFVTRKVTKAVARIALKKQEKLFLGNLDARRDWGYAPEYVEAMWRMLQVKEPKDYVIATGKTYSVRDLVAKAFGVVGLDYQDYVVIDENMIRPADVPLLMGDSSLAKKELGWEPKVNFDQIISAMVEADLERERTR
ncbi:MAG: GDP-mannose 4,6-dehydratase [Firmicutes bacterium]|nr:GDP-mannose 4,6-dehydratase [Bacillota bacterium]